MQLVERMLKIYVYFRVNKEYKLVMFRSFVGLKIDFYVKNIMKSRTYLEFYTVQVKVWKSSIVQVKVQQKINKIKRLNESFVMSYSTKNLYKTFHLGFNVFLTFLFVLSTPLEFLFGWLKPRVAGYKKLY